MHINTSYITGMHRYGNEQCSNHAVRCLPSFWELVGWKLQSYQLHRQLFSFLFVTPLDSSLVRSQSTVFQTSSHQLSHTHTHTRIHSIAFLRPALRQFLPPTACSAVDYIPLVVLLVLFLSFSLSIPAMILPSATRRARSSLQILQSEVALATHCAGTHYPISVFVDHYSKHIF